MDRSKLSPACSPGQPNQGCLSMWGRLLCRSCVQCRQTGPLKQGCAPLLVLPDGMTRLSSASWQLPAEEGTSWPLDSRCSLAYVGLYGRRRPHLVIWHVDRPLEHAIPTHTCNSGAAWQPCDAPSSCGDTSCKTFIDEAWHV